MPPPEELARNVPPAFWLDIVFELCRFKKVLLSWLMMLRGPAAEPVEAFPNAGDFEPLDDVSEPVDDFTAAVAELVTAPELDFEVPVDPELLRSGARTPLDAEILVDGAVAGFRGVLDTEPPVPPMAEELGDPAEPEEPVGGAVITALELERLPDDGGLIRGADTLGAAPDPPEGMDRPALALEPPCECPPLLLPPPPPPGLSPAHARAGKVHSTISPAVKTAALCRKYLPRICNLQYPPACLGYFENSSAAHHGRLCCCLDRPPHCLIFLRSTMCAGAPNCKGFWCLAKVPGGVKFRWGLGFSSGGANWRCCAGRTRP